MADELDDLARMIVALVSEGYDEPTVREGLTAGEPWALALAEQERAEQRITRNERDRAIAWPEWTEDTGEAEPLDLPATGEDARKTEDPVPAPPEMTRDPLPLDSFTRWFPAIQEAHNAAITRYEEAGVITRLQGFLLHVWGIEEIAKNRPAGYTGPDASRTKYGRNVALLAAYARDCARDPVWQRLLGADIRIVRNLNARRLVKYVKQALAAIEAYEAQNK